MANLDRLVIRPARKDDAEMLDYLDELVWGSEMAASEEKFISRIGVYPQGQAVATYNDRLLGFMNSQKITGDDTYGIYQNNSSGYVWPNLTDDGYLTKTHDPKGNVLFLLNLTVVPYVRTITGRGRAEVGRDLIEYMRQLAERENLQRMEGITRVNGFKAYLEQNSDYRQLNEESRRSVERENINSYLQKVVNGELTDPSLTFHLRQGGRVIFQIENAMPADYDSLFWGAFFINPTKR